MTFTIAAATPQCAFVASDTRIVHREPPDGPPLLVSDEGCKILAHNGGWLASGPSVDWLDAMLAGRAPADVMRELDPVHAAIVRERQVTFLVDRTGRRALTWSGEPRFPDATPTTTLASCPNGSDPVVLQRLSRRMIDSQDLANTFDTLGALSADLACELRRDPVDFAIAADQAAQLSRVLAQLGEGVRPVDASASGPQLMTFIVASATPTLAVVIGALVVEPLARGATRSAAALSRTSLGWKESGS